MPQAVLAEAGRVGKTLGYPLTSWGREEPGRVDLATRNLQSRASELDRLRTAAPPRGAQGREFPCLLVTGGLPRRAARNRWRPWC